MNTGSDRKGEFYKEYMLLTFLSGKGPAPLPRRDSSRPKTLLTNALSPSKRKEGR